MSGRGDNRRIPVITVVWCFNPLTQFPLRSDINERDFIGLGHRKCRKPPVTSTTERPRDGVISVRASERLPKSGMEHRRVQWNRGRMPETARRHRGPSGLRSCRGGLRRYSRGASRRWAVPTRVYARDLSESPSRPGGGMAPQLLMVNAIHLLRPTVHS